MDVDVSQMPFPMSLALILDAAGASAVLLVLLRFLDTPDHVDRAWGLYLALIAPPC